MKVANTLIKSCSKWLRIFGKKHLKAITFYIKM